MSGISNARSKDGFLQNVGGGSNAAMRVPTAMIANGPGRAFFRADTRHEMLIFEQGFRPRETETDLPRGVSAIRYRINTQDVDPRSAVCVTPRLGVAALFPLRLNSGNMSDAQLAAYSDPPIETNVYVVRATQVFNTTRVQARFAARSIRDQSADHLNMAQ